MSWLTYKDPTAEIKAFRTIISNEFFKNKIIDCNGDINHWPAIAGSGDMIYIPKEETNNFNKIMKFFLNTKCFLEVCIPLYLKCFTNATLQFVPQCKLPKQYYIKGTHSNNIIKLCNTTSAIHPLKYVTRPGHKEAMTKFLIN